MSVSTMLGTNVSTARPPPTMFSHYHQFVFMCKSITIKHLFTPVLIMQLCRFPFIYFTEFPRQKEFYSRHLRTQSRTIYSELLSFQGSLTPSYCVKLNFVQLRKYLIYQMNRISSSTKFCLVHHFCQCFFIMSVMPRVSQAESTLNCVSIHMYMTTHVLHKENYNNNDDDNAKVIRKSWNSWKHR